jgi:hypothetical protein
MKIHFLLSAQEELDDAFAWYEKQSQGLGFEFLDEVDRAVHRIKIYSESCAILIEGLRRVQLNRFPYGLIYGLDDDLLVIVAVAHLHRKPYYWIDRITE